MTGCMPIPKQPRLQRWRRSLLEFFFTRRCVSCPNRVRWLLRKWARESALCLACQSTFARELVEDDQ